MLLSTPALDIQYKYMEYNGYKTSSIKTRETVEKKNVSVQVINSK